ncbi:MAG: phospho-N-acetylmuramoyl-pentapeptide-transferase, partial [Proteobacteria bacterium SW_6_67_9]
MLLALAQWLAQFDPVFHVVGFLTLRAILSTLTALLLALLVGPAVIERLTAAKVGQYVRDDGPQSHLSKTGTPTMGGALIIVAVVASTLLWADLSNRQVWIALAATLGFGLVGGVDDYRKLVYGNSKGLSAAAKYTGQSLIALAAASYLYYSSEVPAETELIVPFFKSVAVPMGLWFIPFVYLVVVGSSNAVNLTDGLD